MHSVMLNMYTLNNAIKGQPQKNQNTAEIDQPL